jgi:hypothetical protein
MNPIHESLRIVPLNPTASPSYAAGHEIRQESGGFIDTVDATLVLSRLGACSTVTKDFDMELKRNGSQPSARGPAEYFTGTVRVDQLFKAPAPSRSGART